jgi:ribosomal protein S18 acetylase RimI-like enzyme
MTSPFLVRHAIPRDAEGYITLIKAILREQPLVDTPYAPDEFDPPTERIAERIVDVALSYNSLFLVAQSGAHIIAALTCAGGSFAADSHMTALGVYVEQAWRDRGVGSALMRDAMAWAHASPVVRRVELEVFSDNRRAIHVYEKFGFVREGVKRGLYRRGDVFCDMLMMARWLEKNESRIDSADR